MRALPQRATPQPGARAAPDVHVQVVHFLPTLCTRVEQDAETAFGIGVATFLHGQLGGQRHHAAHQIRMFGTHMRHRRNVQLGNDQKVHRRPGRDVVKGEDVVVLVNLARRDLARHDLAEDAVVAHKNQTAEEAESSGMG